MSFTLSLEDINSQRITATIWLLLRTANLMLPLKLRNLPMPVDVVDRKIAVVQGDTDMHTFSDSLLILAAVIGDFFFTQNYSKFPLSTSHCSLNINLPLLN